MRSHVSRTPAAKPANNPKIVKTGRAPNSRSIAQPRVPPTTGAKPNKSGMETSVPTRRTQP